MMRRPIAAASLHQGPLGTVAYFQLGDAGARVVTATFAERDSATFAMPGFQGSRFARSGAAVAVSVRAVTQAAGL
ncbi:MAG: hypothetical protein U1E40_13265 [Amaricoccus sp.]